MHKVVQHVDGKEAEEPRAVQRERGRGEAQDSHEHEQDAEHARRHLILVHHRPPCWDGAAGGPAVAVRTKARSTSATLQPWAMQPRGVKGASASKISLMLPTHASSR